LSLPPIANDNGNVLAREFDHALVEMRESYCEFAQIRHHGIKTLQCSCGAGDRRLR